MSEIDVLMIRGAPGVGKSTLGRALRAALACGAVVEVDDVRAMLSRVDWADRHQHDIALVVSLAAICTFVQQGRRPVVLIDTFSRSRLRGAQERLDALQLRHYTLSLWLAPSELAARLEARRSGFKAWEPSRILNEEVLENRYDAERLIDVGPRDREGMLALVLDIVERGGVQT